MRRRDDDLRRRLDRRLAGQARVAQLDEKTTRANGKWWGENVSVGVLSPRGDNSRTTICVGGDDTDRRKLEVDKSPLAPSGSGTSRVGWERYPECLSKALRHRPPRAAAQTRDLHFIFLSWQRLRQRHAPTIPSPV